MRKELCNKLIYSILVETNLKEIKMFREKSTTTTTSTYKTVDVDHTLTKETSLLSLASKLNDQCQIAKEEALRLQSVCDLITKRNTVGKPDDKENTVSGSYPLMNLYDDSACHLDDAINVLEALVSNLIIAGKDDNDVYESNPVPELDDSSVEGYIIYMNNRYDQLHLVLQVLEQRLASVSKPLTVGLESGCTGEAREMLPPYLELTLELTINLERMNDILRNQSSSLMVGNL